VGRALEGKVALVTGGSGRVGGGVAEGLAEAGAEVYLTARTLKRSERVLGSTGSLEETVERIQAAGGKARPIQCDHTDDHEVRRAFERIVQTQGKLDILVNAVWGGYREMRAARFRGEDTIEAPEDDPNPVLRYSVWASDFWEQPIGLWDAMVNQGARATYVARAFAARQMVKQGSGVIANITVIGPEGARNVVYGSSHVVVGYLTRAMADRLKPHGVSVVSVYPGNVFPRELDEAERRAVPADLTGNSETPLFVGRAIAVLAADPELSGCWGSQRCR